MTDLDELQSSLADYDARLIRLIRSACESLGLSDADMYHINDARAELWDMIEQAAWDQAEGEIRRARAAAR